MIGSGQNPYQFISVYDCASAARLAWKAGVPNEAYNLGSIDPPPVQQAAGDLVKHAGSKSILVPTPGWAVKAHARLPRSLNMPLMDPEQYLIADEYCVLDVTKGKRELDWVPQHRDEDMLIAAYREYRPRRSASARPLRLARRIGRPHDRGLTSLRCRPTSPALVRRPPSPGQARSADRRRRQGLGVDGSPSCSRTHQSRPAPLHEAARLPQGQDRACRRHVLRRPERPEDPRLLRRLRLARLRPQPSAHHRCPAGNSRTRSATRSPWPSCRNTPRAGQEPGAVLAGRPRHGVSGLDGLGGDGGGDQGRRARRRAARTARSSMPRTRSTARRRACCRSPTGPLYRGDFKLHRQHACKVPFGDIDASARVREPTRGSASSCSRRSRAAAASSRRRPNSGRSCARCATGTSVLWVADEVQCGYGPNGALLRLRAFRRRPRRHGSRQVAGRRQGRHGRDDRQARRLHEGLWHAEDRDDPRRRRRSAASARPASPPSRRSTCSTTRA